MFQIQYNCLRSIIIFGVSGKGLIEVMAYVIGALLFSSTSASTATNRVICTENEQYISPMNVFHNSPLGHQENLLEYCKR